MIKRKASEIFAGVDPHLRVIDGGIHRRRGNGQVKDADWNAAGGLNCPQCGAETVRLVGGLCLQCHKEAEARRIEKLERVSEKRYYIEQLRSGRMTLTQMKNLRPGSPR